MHKTGKRGEARFSDRLQGEIEKVSVTLRVHAKVTFNYFQTAKFASSPPSPRDFTEHFDCFASLPKPFLRSRKLKQETGKEEATPNSDTPGGGPPLANNLSLPDSDRL